MVNITVIDVPAAPMITAYTPKDSLLQMAKQDLAFTISASDADGNYLYYSWWLNGVMVAPSGTEFNLRYKASLPSRSRLVVRVSDGLFIVEHVWTLDIQSSVAESAGMPTEFSLLQNYPNPFNPSTRIRFSVAKPSRVRLRIIDNSGRLVNSLADADYSVGRYEIEWNGRDEHGSAVSSGVYLCIMECEGYNGVRKVIFMK